MKPLVVCGIEIEMEYNRKNLSIHRDGYHHHHQERADYAWFGKHFIAESDSSLNVSTFESGDVCEMVSVPFSIDNGMKVIDGFIKKFGEFELKDVVSFNDTTGAHIHLSVLNVDKEGTTTINARPGVKVNFKGRPMFFRDAVGANILDEIKGKLLSRVKEELPKSLYDKWSGSLVRDNYAEKLIPNRLFAERKREWNLTHPSRIEYRGFTLRGVKTWEQLRKMYDILFSVINEVVLAEFSKEQPFLSEEEHPTEVHYNQLGYMKTQLKSDYLMNGFGLIPGEVNYDVGLSNSTKRRRYTFGVSRPMDKELNLVVDMKQPIPTRNRREIHKYLQDKENEDPLERVWVPTDDDENEYDEGDD